jgi:WXG100 family type VII secretion target
MTGPMKTDPATLRAEAANFDRIGTELTTVIKGVESTGGELAQQMVSEGAGTAAQDALQRFHEAGQAQIKALTDIHNNISHAGIQYQRSNEDAAASLKTQMMG